MGDPGDRVFSIFQSNLSHYPVYLLSALIAWTFFSQTTTYSAGSFLSGGSLLKRIYLPRTAFTVAAVLNGLVNLAISVVPLVIIMIAVGHPLRVTVVVRAGCRPAAGDLRTGCGARGVRSGACPSPDIVEMYQILAQSWFYMTPIIFPAEILPARFQWLDQDQSDALPDRYLSSADLRRRHSRLGRRSS